LLTFDQALVGRSYCSQPEFSAFAALWAGHVSWSDPVTLRAWPWLRPEIHQLRKVTCRMEY